MDRRAFVAALLGALAAPVLRAQPGRAPVQLGFLRIVAPPKINIDALEQGLRDRGYVPGRDVVIEYRFADDREGQLDALAKELVERKVAIILVAGNQATRAARKATRTIPIVMAVVNDPVASGFVTSLARPGGNITGTTLLSSTLAGKRLELAEASASEGVACGGPSQQGQPRSCRRMEGNACWGKDASNRCPAL